MPHQMVPKQRDHGGAYALGPRPPPPRAALAELLGAYDHSILRQDLVVAHRHPPVPVEAEEVVNWPLAKPTRRRWRIALAIGLARSHPHPLANRLRCWALFI